MFAEPSLRRGPAAVLLATGYPNPPASAWAAWARVAKERGARIMIGSAARPAIEASAASGVLLADGTRIGADAVLVAAGPWTSELIDPDGAPARIRPTWGVTLQLRLDGDAPRHIVEEDEVDSINRAAAATERAALETGDDPPSLFSLASAGGVSALGSTFLPSEPDPALIQPLLLRRAAEFLPLVERAEILERRICARPSPSTAARSSARSRVSRACMSAPATGHGESARDPRRRRWSRGPFSTAPLRHPSSRPRDRCPDLTRSRPACAQCTFL